MTSLTKGPSDLVTEGRSVHKQHQRGQKASARGAGGGEGAGSMGLQATQSSLSQGEGVWEEHGEGRRVQQEQ